MALKKSELYSSLSSSCDELRGGMDASQYKDYVLVLLFIKYVSDKYAGQPYAPITITVDGLDDVATGWKLEQLRRNVVPVPCGASGATRHSCDCSPHQRRDDAVVDSGPRLGGIPPKTARIAGRPSRRNCYLTW